MAPTRTAAAAHNRRRTARWRRSIFYCRHSRYRRAATGKNGRSCRQRGSLVGGVSLSFFPCLFAFSPVWALAVPPHGRAQVSLPLAAPARADGWDRASLPWASRALSVSFFFTESAMKTFGKKLYLKKKSTRVGTCGRCRGCSGCGEGCDGKGRDGRGTLHALWGRRGLFESRPGVGQVLGAVLWMVGGMPPKAPHRLRYCRSSPDHDVEASPFFPRVFFFPGRLRPFAIPQPQVFGVPTEKKLREPRRKKKVGPPLADSPQEALPPFSRCRTKAPPFILLAIQKKRKTGPFL